MLILNQNLMCRTQYPFALHNIHKISTTIANMECQKGEHWS